jgi:hypothetical protein
MRKNLNDKPYTMHDIIQTNRRLDSILDEIISSGKDHKLNGTHDITGDQHVLQFFQPDNTFIQWIKEYANGRLIIDVGCGGGDLIWMLSHYGAKVIGIEPSFDPMSAQKLNMERIKANLGMLHIISKPIEDCGSFFKNMGDKVLLLFARPSHSNFVVNALNMKDAETEALYITIPENLEKYDDLGRYDHKKVLVPHTGKSVEDEQVYSIR